MTGSIDDVLSVQMDPKFLRNQVWKTTNMLSLLEATSAI